MFLFICERERKAETEKHQSVAYTHPDQGSNPNPFWCMRQGSNQLIHPDWQDMLFYSSESKSHLANTVETWEYNRHI